MTLCLLNSWQHFNWLDFVLFFSSLRKIKIPFYFNPLTKFIRKMEEKNTNCSDSICYFFPFGRLLNIFLLYFTLSDLCMHKVYMHWQKWEKSLNFFFFFYLPEMSPNFPYQIPKHKRALFEVQVVGHHSIRLNYLLEIFSV